MCSNKFEYSTAEITYCMTHYVKVPFYIPEFSNSKIILNLFHIDSNEVESGIGCGMILGHYLMIQLGLPAEFKRQLFQCYDITVPMK